MVDFSAFVPEDGLPIYLQIIRHVKRAIAAGTVQAGDELPSRRVLSAQLGVNPNTVQKAYKLLEDEGIIPSLIHIYTKHTTLLYSYYTLELLGSF